MLKSHILPSPIKPRARWDSWEKSPLDPKVPFSGIKGKISWLKASINFSIVVTEIPLCPFDKVLILQVKTIRVWFGVIGSPTPAQWDRIKFFWSLRMSSSSMIMFTKFPMPVLTPFYIFLFFTMSFIKFLSFWILFQVSFCNAILWLPLDSSNKMQGVRF